MKLRYLPALAGCLLGASLAVHANPAPGEGAPAGAHVSFVGLKDGAVVPATVTVKFGIKGMKVRPAGEDPYDRASGHHHLVIDAPPVPQGQVVPTDEKHMHFGKGQTEATITLTPGPHTLTLQFADGAHSSYGPALAATVHVKVEDKPAK
ncbi:DUF4399 domain-containing protein [Chitinimonas arctica]|uniref:DUF4399 domain-containing protein n=1 Tax=Chitinimonas arctica TaxID=2594795 RepID=A0A516SFJ4_9NEIS|nr:DUF4399 domain-containing protein [Chitinimonas arctica]QDQ26798.1 DUF4399 domain-containing protein [Chitinimonas arctica]